MRAGSIFSGIGGIELGLGLPVAWHVENDPHASSILERHFPGVPNLGDITRVEWSRLEPVDLLVGGPPCQPISSAGQRKGAEDHRWLWPFAIDAIRALGPRFFLLENPTDLLGFPEWRDVLGAVAADGRYEVRWDVFRACDVGAPHERERVFIFGALDSAGNSALVSGAPADAHSEGVPPRGRRGVSGASSSGSGGAPERQRLRAGAVDGRATPADAPFHRLAGVGISRGWGTGLENDGGTAAPDAEGREAHTPEPGRLHPEPCRAAAVDWGVYALAVNCWERFFGRPAPPPVDERGRLSVLFVEWMQGFPPGWVDGIPRTAALRCLGNAVLPRVAALAWSVLTAESIGRTAVASVDGQNAKILRAASAILAEGQ